MIQGIGGNPLSAYGQLSDTQNSISKAIAELSSGSRINSAADDAAGLSISTNLQSDMRGLQTASRNAQDGINLAQTADGGLGQTTSLLQHLRDLAVQAGNGAAGPGALSALGADAGQTIAAIDGISQSTSFGSQNLLDGSNPAGFTFNIGASAAASNQVTVATPNSGSAALGIAGAAAAITAGANLSGTLTSIDNAITSVNSARSTLGATQDQFSSTLDSIGSGIQNLASSDSPISSTDYAQGTSDLSAAKIKSEFTLSLMAQANSLSRSTAMQLLGK